MPGQGKTVFFLFNLLQDVNILRGVVYLAARETIAPIVFLISQGFLKRDQQKIWQRELATVAADAKAKMYLYGSPEEARAVLEDGSGLIFAASESRLPNHAETSDVFRAAPSGYLRVSLQHGLECVGFLQSREHVMSHGRNVSFEADVVCGWLESSSLTSLTASERAKLCVTGPSTLLQQPASDAGAETGGLVCENMHSVRLRASGDHKTSFMGTFFAFCAKMDERGETVTLRPHPGGRYVLKNNVSLPSNVQLNMLPMYKLDLSQYRFGISAPSSVVLDMVLAGIPVGLWRDPDGVMDAGNYRGLTEISSLGDWLAFERDVRLRPEMILDRQEAFLRSLGMPLDPADVYRRFARFIVAALEGLPKNEGDEPFVSASAPRPVALCGDLLVEAA
jgi:hypothetical protein